MSRSVVVCLCAIVALVGAPLVHPAMVRAASGTLRIETPLHDSPDPAAAVIALLPEGSVVSIDGPPVDGFYPVTAGDLSGWMSGETLSVEKDRSESAAADDREADPLVDDTDETDPGNEPVALDPTTDTSAAPEGAPPVAESVPEVGTPPARDAVPDEALAPVRESAPVNAVPDGAVAEAPASELDSMGTPVPVASDAEPPPPDAASTPSTVAAATTVDPNVTPIPVPELAAVGSASVTADAPLLLGPGPEYGFIASVPAGSTVVQTGHVIDGYATVQYAEVTGWVALDHLGAPNPRVAETPSAQTVPVSAPIADAASADAPPAGT